jgi:hypothetical protein
MYVERGASFEACFDSGVSGKTGICSLMVIDDVGGIWFPASTANIVETPPGSGIYCAVRTAPIVVGQYSLVWSLDGTYDPATVGIDDLIVTPTASPALPPLPPPGEGGLSIGPCNAWTTVQDVAACCRDPGIDNSDTTWLNESIIVASEILYEVSGRRFAGQCTTKVRPNRTDDCMFALQMLPRGFVVGWGDYGWLWYTWDRYYWEGLNGGCKPLSRIKLAGSVREILEVKVDGSVVDPTTYRLDEERWLVRKDGLKWPRCQLLDRDDTEQGTFSVTYTYGRGLPLVAQQAASQLACEIFKACSGSEDCALPTGVTRVSRQGITFERAFLQRDRNGIWRTGLGLVDLFLNTINPHGIPRRAIFFGANNRNRYARRAG